MTNRWSDALPPPNHRHPYSDGACNDAHDASEDDAAAGDDDDDDDCDGALFAAAAADLPQSRYAPGTGPVRRRPPTSIPSKDLAPLLAAVSSSAAHAERDACGTGLLLGCRGQAPSALNWPAPAECCWQRRTVRTRRPDLPSPLHRPPHPATRHCRRHN